MIETEILRCPVTGSSIDSSMRSTAGDMQYTYENGVYNLLPRCLDAVKQGEDTVYADNSEELQHILARPWRKIIARNEVLRFDHEIIDLLSEGRFLELGGESCFCSAIFKSVFPQSTVYATDVSPNTLRNVAVPVGGFFPQQPDFYAAVDAENIPFQDAVFDSIFAMTMMHHLPNPIKMLKEVNRVLKPGGTFIAIDHCVPRHFRWLFQQNADNRALKYGIQEELFSYSVWTTLLRESHMPMESFKVYTNPAYQYNPFYILAGNVINKLPRAIVKYMFPVGVMLLYCKQ
jgi:ubiquinone/menaquinone biosynthesis C-methylase UbiE